MRHYDIPGCLDHQHSTNFEWREAGGGIQSLCFYLSVLDVIGPVDDKGTIHDYGCGMGDGIALIQAAIPHALCRGFDVDGERIAGARNRWPTIPFQIGNVATTGRKADIIMSIHTLEHVPNALSVVSRLRSLCKSLVIVYPDLTHEARGGHSLEALAADEFCEGVKEHATHMSHYVTARRYSHDEPLMLEGNNLFVLEGER
ncbi:hypothetical protein LCGC14_3135820 [marine sediment metagenome]|uniref:Methyltransferase domain-containing protein n=1 Tax=marine sediment metagenome TaxID=412755 RepID=A0A0F8VYD2_9ZZZZ